MSAAESYAYNFNASFRSKVFLMPVPNNGTYTRTQYSVTVYTESGHCKGTYSIYLHHGKKYINFYNTWICIQGKSRFAYNGNWYVIK